MIGWCSTYKIETVTVTGGCCWSRDEFTLCSTSTARVGLARMSRMVISKMYDKTVCPDNFATVRPYIIEAR